MRRLAIVLSHPVQYYSPWFRWLRAHTSLDFRVFYLWEFGVTRQVDPEFKTAFTWDTDLLSGYDHEFVPNVSPDPGAHHFRGFDNPTLPARLAAWNPGAVLLFGYNWSSHLRVIWWARRQGVPLVFRGDSHVLGRGALPFSRRVPLRLLYRQFQAVTYVGAANRDYFRQLGVPDPRLFFAPHCVDAAHFNADDATTGENARLKRESLGLGGKRVVLFAGKFHDGKQPLELLRTFLDVAAADDALVFVGDGERKEALQALAATQPEKLVRFLPFANQSEMPSLYRMSDIFALPSKGSYETWGLAVNEAMSLGVPCLVSDLVGCQRDLVTDGETGWVFSAAENGALARALGRALATSPDELRRLSRNARERVGGYTYAQATDGLLAAIASLPAA